MRSRTDGGSTVADMAVPPRLEDLLRPGTSAMVLTGLFEEAGHELYLVGGSVRDALLDRDARDRDLDFATSARPDEIRAVVGEWADSLYLAGQDFGTVAALKDGERYEITTFRSEVYREESRKPQVTYSDDIVEDLSRRDFTVNAMALHLSSSHAPEMIDPHGGLADLGARVLRTPLEPSMSFGDDPLRMLRLFRFASSGPNSCRPESSRAVSAVVGNHRPRCPAIARQMGCAGYQRP